MSDPTPLTFSRSAAERHRLRVATGDPCTEIFVVDDRFDLVAEGLGEVEARLPTGSYLVKLRSGDQRREEWVALDRDRTVRPARGRDDPEDADAWSPALLEQASDLCRDGNVAVVVRDPKRETLGADRVSLHRLDGGAIVGLAEATAAAEGWNVATDRAVVGFGGFVEQGTYRLRVQTPGIGTFELAVPVGGRVQTTVYLTRRSVGAPGRRRRVPHLASASILVTRPGLSTAARHRHAQAVLTATAWLARREPPLPPLEELEQASEPESPCPMLGLVTAVLLLKHVEMGTAPEGSRALLSKVVDAVEEALPSSPDVGALRLALGQDAREVFGAPPTLRPSWSVVTAHDARDRLVPPESLAARIGPGIVASFPWLVWDVSKLLGPAAGSGVDASLRLAAQYSRATGLTSPEGNEELARQRGWPVTTVDQIVARLDDGKAEE